MTVTREDLNPCTVKLTVTAEPAEVDAAFDKALKRAAKEVRVPGFRPGHAPKSMVENMIHPERLAEDAADQLVRATFQKAVEDQAIRPDPGTRPSVALEEFDRSAKKAVYSAKVPLPPVIELGEYKGVAITSPDLGVTDEEVEYQLDEIRRRKGTREAVEGRGLQEGDVAVVNIKIDGEEGEGRNFMTVVGRTFPQLDEAITGMAAEEIKSLELSFPQGFGDPSWADTTKKVQVTVSSASTVRMPALTDEFAQSNNAESVDDLKNRIRESLGAAKSQMGREMMQEQILEKLRTVSTIHVSDNMWEALAQQRLSEIAQDQAKEGKSLQQYAEENGMSLEALVDSWNEQAKVHVERAMVVRDVFEKEGLQVTNSDLNTELLFMAQEYSVQPQELLQMLQSNNSLPELQFRAISRKVTDFLLANATMEAEGAATPAAPAKKASKPKKGAEAPGADATEAPTGEVAVNGDTVAEAKPKKAPAKKKAAATDVPAEATPVSASDAPEENGSAS